MSDAHDASCAIVRQGESRAWCNCGADLPLGHNTEEFALGRLYERRRILTRLRYSAGEFESLAQSESKWGLVAEIMAEEADVIETGDYWKD